MSEDKKGLARGEYVSKGKRGKESKRERAKGSWKKGDLQNHGLGFVSVSYLPYRGVLLLHISKGMYVWRGIYR